MECKKCGNCCQTISIPIRTPSDRQLEFWAARGYEVKNTKQGWFLYIPGPCIHLIEDNLCDIYENRPEMCRKHWCNI
jgi:Fe-S-cluster containining protein